MKTARYVTAVLLSAFFLQSCGTTAAPKDQSVLFYYQRAQYQYGTPDGVIVSEKREVDEHLSDYFYYLTLYLLGPMHEDLVSPFPEGTTLVSIRKDGDTLVVTLSNQAEGMEDSHFSLAASCLALTCMDIGSVDGVTVISGSRSIDLARDSFYITDNVEDNVTVNTEEMP